MFQSEKSPDGVYDYTIDWSDWLTSDTIVSHTIAVSGVTLVQSSNTTNKTVSRISGGLVDTLAEVKHHIVTTAGLEESRTIQVAIKQL